MRATPHTWRLLLALFLLNACGEQTSDAPTVEPRPPLQPVELTQEAEIPVLPRAMTPTERQAIAEARSRHVAVQESKGQRSDMKPGPTGLTHHEQQAAQDDPAATLRNPGQPAPPPSVQSPLAPPAKAPSPSGAESTPRAGVSLQEAHQGLKLVDLAIATEVKRREPLGISDTFTVMPRMFHCFCVFENRQEPVTVTHVWRRDGRVVSRVELEVGKSPKWRTWSRQRLQPAWTGEWTCEVQSAQGQVLGTARVIAGR